MWKYFLPLLLFACVCAQSIKYTQINVKNAANEGDQGQCYLIADDYMRSLRNEIKNSKTLSALHILYENGTENVAIQYESSQSNGESLYYRAFVEINLISFVLKEKNFQNIKKDDLRKPGVYIFGPSNPTVSSSVINSSNNVTNVQNISPAVTSAPISAPNPTVAPTSTPIAQNPNVTVSDANGAWPPGNTVGYQTLNNIDLLKDVTFLLAKDLVNKQLSGYNDLLPIQTFVQTYGNSKIYIMTFTKSNKVSYEINATVNTATYVPKIIYQHKLAAISTLAPSTTTPSTTSVSSGSSRVYITKNIADIIKTPFFIAAAVEIAKSVNGYQTDNLVSIATNEEDANIIYYQAVYNMGGKYYQVESLVKKKLFAAQLISEKQIPAPQDAPAHTSTNQNPTSTPVPTPTPSNSSTISTLNTTNSSTSAPNQDNKNLSPSINTSNTNFNQTIVNNTNNSLKNTTQDSYTLPAQIDQLILDQVAGFNQLTAKQVTSDPSYLKVDNFLRTNNAKVLNKAKMHVAYDKIVGLTRYFKLYYQCVDTNTYEAFVTFDQLRDRQYIVSFNPIIYGAKSILN